MNQARLHVNLGNSSLQWGVWEARGGWLAEGRLSAGEPGPTWGTLAGMLPGNLAAEVPVVASRADAERWMVAGTQGLAKNMVVMGRDFRGVFATAYHRPEQLGQDRVANVIAARVEGLYPCLILDAGTCLTADVLDMEGRHQGGAIAAGGPALLAGVSRRAPHLGTAAERARVMLGLPEWGRSTEENLALGWELGLVGIAEAIVRRYRRVTDTEGAVILTGGDAEFLAEHLGQAALMRPRLTLEGLRLAYEKDAVAR